MLKQTVAALTIVLAQGCGDASQSLLNFAGGKSQGGASAKLSSAIESPIVEEEQPAAAPAEESESAPVIQKAPETEPSIVIQSEPVSEAKAVFNAAGIETHLIEGETRSIVYAREMDQAAAEQAIEQIKIMQGNSVTWDLLLRPNEEILTPTGFQSPPPSVADILDGRDISGYEIAGNVITVFESQERSALSALEVIAVFYPNGNWSIATKPDPMPEPAPEPEPDPETP